MSTIPRLLLDRSTVTPDLRAYTAHVDGRWRDYSWRDYEDTARAFGLGLIDLGLQRGDVVAILGATRHEWVTCDLGALGVGAVTVGLYPTLQPEGIGSMRYVLEHSDAKWLVVESTAVLEQRIGPILGKLPKVQKIIVWDCDARARALDARVMSLDEVSAKGRALHVREPSRWLTECESVQPNDLAVLVYTSGTTGQPKGAMLSHGNIWALQASLDAILPPRAAGERTVSFLPMAHAAERCVSHYGRIKTGFATHFARSMDTLLEDIALARPTRFGSVPRIFEKVYTKVQGDLGKVRGWRGKLAREAFRAGVEAGRMRTRGEQPDLRTRLLAQVFERRIARVLRERFGGQCGWFISGAAPIAVEILEFFDACGMPTFEVYGMTETTAIATANRPGAVRYGTVGKPIPGVDVKIAEDGEILIRGRTVFLGYLKDPEATAEAVKDGWMHTGDIGTIDADGYVRITDRKKNILITAAGKNITPSNLENEVKNHRLISFCHMHADKRAYPTALICLDGQELAMFAKERGLPGTTAEALRDHPVVREEIDGRFRRRMRRSRSTSGFASSRFCRTSFRSRLGS